VASGDAGASPDRAVIGQLSICAMTRDELQSDTWAVCVSDAGYVNAMIEVMRVLKPPRRSSQPEFVHPSQSGKPQ